MQRRKSPDLVALGRQGGQATSEAKAEAARENGRNGGRPAIPTRCPRCKRMQPSARGAWMHCRG